MVTEDRPASHNVEVDCDCGEGSDNDLQEATVTPKFDLDGKDMSNGARAYGLDSSSSEKMDIDETVIIEANGVTQELGSTTDEKSKEQDGVAAPEAGDDSTKAPDGGYGWVICFGVFLNHLIYGGLNRSEGLYYLQFKKRFDTSAQLTAWPASLMSTINLFMGPLCGAVVSRYSVRTAFIIGTFISSLGMFLNGFAPNIYFLFFSHTILGGFGRGLLTGILILNLYFDKHRSLVTGVSMSGVGLGSLCIVPFTQYLFDSYGFTGTFMILSGLALHGMVVAMILRPLSMHLKFTRAAARRKRQDHVMTEEGVALSAVSNGHTHSDEHFSYQTDIKTLNNTQKSNLQETNHSIDESANHDSNSIASNGKVTSDTAKKLASAEHYTENHDDKIQNGNASEPLMTECSGVITSSNTSHLRKRKPDGFIKSSLKILFPVEHNRKKGGAKKDIFTWSLLKNLPFMTFVVSNFLFVLAFKTTLVFLPALAMSKGLTDTEAALLLTLSGAFDTFGRLALGFIMDLRPLRPYRPYVFNLLYALIAALSLLVPSLNDFASFAIVCSAYGMLTGSSIAQKIVVLIDVVGRDVLPSSLGIMKCFQGFGTLIGPPLAGALRDALGNYDMSFYLGGASMFGATLCLALSNFLLWLQKRKSCR